MIMDVASANNSINIILDYLRDLKEERRELLRKLEKRKRQKKLVNNEIKRLNEEIKKIDDDIKFWRQQLKGLVKS